MNYDINKIFISNYIIYNELSQKYKNYDYYLKYIIVQKVKVSGETKYIRYENSFITEQIDPKNVKNGMVGACDYNYNNFSGKICFGKLIPIYPYTTEEERKIGLITSLRIYEIFLEVNGVGIKKENKSKVLKFNPTRK